MFVVNFIFKAGTVQSLAFNDGDVAQRKFEEAKDSKLDNYLITDDYGVVAEINSNDVAGYTIIDVKKDLERQGELELLRAKQQIKSQNAFKNDPSLNVQKMFAAN